MEPISVAALAALAGGIGGEAGRQAWVAPSALVRRPFQRGEIEGAGSTNAVRPGEAELTALERSPSDAVRAQALSTALAVRAALDKEFRSALEGWWQQAKLVRTGDGEVHNQISNGTIHGSVVQGRDFSGISFTTTSAPSAAPDASTPSE